MFSGRRAVGGKLAIVLQDGRIVFLPASKHQCSFENVQIASDGIAVGWTEGESAEGQSDIECGPNSIYVAAGPAVWRKGKLLHRLKNSGAEMNWSFYRGGKSSRFMRARAISATSKAVSCTTALLDEYFFKKEGLASCKVNLKVN